MPVSILVDQGLRLKTLEGWKKLKECGAWIDSDVMVSLKMHMRMPFVGEVEATSAGSKVDQPAITLVAIPNRLR